MIPLVREVAGYSGQRLVWGALGLALLVGLYLAASLSWLCPPGLRTWALLGALAAATTALPLVFGDECLGMPIYLGMVRAMTLPMRWVPIGLGKTSGRIDATRLMLDAFSRTR
jgi:hypothetical protein